jgi:hypothetical protein
VECEEATFDDFEEARVFWNTRALSTSVASMPVVRTSFADAKPGDRVTLNVDMAFVAPSVEALSASPLPLNVPPVDGREEDIASVDESAAAPQTVCPAGAEPSGWRDISCAPKNATDVLVVWPTERGWPKRHLMVAHWAQGGGEDQPRFGPAWFRWGGYGFVELNPAPTHWMPLPPLPAESSLSGPTGSE